MISMILGKEQIEETEFRGRCSSTALADESAVIRCRLWCARRRPKAQTAIPWLAWPGSEHKG